MAQARAAGQRLAQVPFDAAYASDLSRAAQTAHFILEARDGLSALHDQGLREMHYGEWEARPYSELLAEAPEAVKRFLTGREACAPGGETLAQLRERTAAVARKLAAGHPEGNVLVVSHGNAIMAMLAELLGVPLAATWSFVVDNTSISELHFSRSGRFLLKSFNDAAHIEGIE
jgi:broad specificity phosphatase PhoE